MITIQEIQDFPFAAFSELLAESEDAGFRFLRRLKEDWLNKANRFDKEGEGLFLLWKADELIGIGGINRDPYCQNKKIGRLRRFYIKADQRSQGLGALLLKYIIAEKGKAFQEIQLYTDTESAARFYEKQGFERVFQNSHFSHRLILE